MVRETLYQVFQRSPQEALEQSIAAYSKRAMRLENCIFCWQSTLGVGDNANVRYGSYRVITRAELERRPHEIEYLDDEVSIFWKDMRHDSHTHMKVPVDV